MARLIPKLPKPTDVSQRRHIALSSCVQKLYCAILALLLEHLSKPLSREACGSRKGHQVAEITEALRIGLEQSKLYGQQMVVIQADARKAVDHVSRSGFNIRFCLNWLAPKFFLFLNMLRFLARRCCLRLENKEDSCFLESNFGLSPCRGCYCVSWGRTGLVFTGRRLF